MPRQTRRNQTEKDRDYATNGHAPKRDSYFCEGRCNGRPSSIQTRSPILMIWRMSVFGRDSGGEQRARELSEELLAPDGRGGTARKCQNRKSLGENARIAPIGEGRCILARDENESGQEATAGLTIS